MTNRLLLVDGNSIMNRAYYAMANQGLITAPDGTPTGAISVFFNSVLSVMSEYKTTSVCVCFDLSKPTFRHLMYKDYKGTRKGTPPELRVQFPIVKELLDLLGISRIELEGFEADDLIGTLSRIAEENGDEVFILSGDKDDFQLISDSVSVVYPKSGKPPRVLYDKEKFLSTYSCTPSQFIDVKALMGDKSDNIIGINKVGDTTACKLINQYGSLDNIIANIDKLTPSMRANMEEGKDRLSLNRILCEIKRDLKLVDYYYDMTNLLWDTIKSPNDLHEKLKFLGMNSLIHKLKLENYKIGSSSDNLSNDKGQDSIESKLYDSLIEDLNTFTVVEEIPSFDNIGEYVAISRTGDKALLTFDCKNCYLIHLEKLPSILETISNKNVDIVAFDYKKRFKSLSTTPNINSIFDTSILGYVLNYLSGNEPDFERLFASSFVGFKFPIEAETTKQLSLFEEPNDDTQDSLKEMIVNAYIYKRLKPLITENNMERLMYDIEFPLVITLDNMERNGMYVSSDKLSELHIEFENRLNELSEKIFDLVGERFNISSPKQLSIVLFEHLELPSGKKGKNGSYSTSVEELQRLKSLHPVVPLIIEYRAISKLDSTYALGLMKSIDDDSRIRTTFTQAMTNTGRLSSTEPNLQNIPIRSDDGSRIRDCFIAPDGRVLVDADYSQIELRLLAHMSGDEVMCDAFRQGEDIHRRTAMNIFKKSGEEVTSRERSIAKTVNFSIVYGVSEFGLATDLGIDYYEAKKIIEDYGKSFPKITAYLSELKRLGEEKQYALTMFGRKRILHELLSSNRNIHNFGLRTAMNTPIQGTSADIIKLAMNNTYKRLRSECPAAMLIMTVHDELIVECDEKDRELVQAILKEEMENVVKLSIPLISDCSFGKSWLEAK